MTMQMSATPQKTEKLYVSDISARQMFRIGVFLVVRATRFCGPASRHRGMESGVDNTDLRDLLEFTHTQLNTIRKAVAASGHARAMFSIDCLVGAAAEQAKCKLAGLNCGDMPMGRRESIDAVDDGVVASGKLVSGRAGQGVSPRPRRSP